MNNLADTAPLLQPGTDEAYRDTDERRLGITPSRLGEAGWFRPIAQLAPGGAG